MQGGGQFRHLFFIPKKYKTCFVSLLFRHQDRGGLKLILSGSLAEREHHKWSHSAVLMPNNPYTKENAMMRKYSKNLGKFMANPGYLLMNESIIIYRIIIY